jgi:hypothetical protein
MRLDDRWQTGYWVGDSAPPAPIGKCQACGRRAAWLVAGGSEDEEAKSDDWFLRQQVYLCGWCSIVPEAPIESAAELDEALVAARSRSVAQRERNQLAARESPFVVLLTRRSIVLVSNQTHPTRLFIAARSYWTRMLLKAPPGPAA